MKEDNSIKRRLYEAFMNFLIHWCSNIGLSASSLAAEQTFGPDWESDSRRRVLHCGLDFSPFHRQTDRAEVRTELGIQQDALVIGTVGRLTKQKNPLFMVRILAEVMHTDSRVFGVFVGEGDLEDSAQALASELRIAERIAFLGSRDDVPQLLTSCFDVFLFPSLGEGLGLAIVEAQAAGLPCVISDIVPKEADVVKHLITRLSLDTPLEDWAEAVLSAAETKPPVSQVNALEMVEKSPFTIEHAVPALMDVYLGK
jgi:glycosyltransferase involved in cell wall biosynthesis